MSILKNFRNLSNMQFYKTAAFIRKDLTEWMMRDFGTTRNKKVAVLKYSYMIITDDDEEKKEDK